LIRVPIDAVFVPHPWRGGLAGAQAAPKEGQRARAKARLAFLRDHLAPVAG